MSHPTIYWAQNKEVVYLRVAVMGAENVVADIENEKFKIECEAQKKKYSCEFNLFKPIKKEESKYRVMGQGIEVLLKKDEETKEFWTQVNNGGKLPYVKIDWERWQDEEEEKAEKPIQDFSGMDFGGLSGQMPDMNNFKLPENEEHEHHEGCECGHEHNEQKCEDENCECEHK
uniref:Putative Wos2 protein n=1 Tax=Trepomonas sp. PC1 TaxID=1076344 RepID=A0A146K755_9EUKA|eukprot:JAP92672.1 Putative Wos2 protein [Trepomonas sp. PC1]